MLNAIHTQGTTMNTRGLVSQITLMGIALVGLATIAASQGTPDEKAMPMNRQHHSEPPAAAGNRSLFDRIGGTYAIAAMVDDYIDNLVKDQTVMANPMVQAAVAQAASAH